MLLPRDEWPENSAYYVGALLIDLLTKTDNEALALPDLFLRVKEQHGVAPALFFLAIDWLYLVGAIRVTSEGVISLCS
jgi:hypothetical protein